MERKRTANHQITKDDPDVEEEGESEQPGTWQKADSATLAARKIRKAKRPTAAAGGSAGSSNPFGSVQLAAAPASNPFGNVQLIAPAASAPASSSSPFAFGATAPATASTFTFGAPTSTASPASSSAAPFTFGGAPSSPAAAPFLFGGAPPLPPSAAAPAATPAAPFIFGGAAPLPPSAAPAAAPFLFGGAPPAPAPAPSASAANSANSANSANLFDSFAPPPAPAPAADAPPPAAGFVFGSTQPAAPPPAAASGAIAPEDAAALNEDFLAHLQAEWAAGRGVQTADWSEAAHGYIAQRAALSSGAPPPSPSPAAPLFGAPPSAAPPPFAAPPPAAAGLFAAPSPSPAAPPPQHAASRGEGAPPIEGGADHGADVRWKGILKLSVYRKEERHDNGELKLEGGWKPVGRGLLRLLHDEGVYFLEFRPLVSDGPEASEGAEVQEVDIDSASSKQRFGRAVLSARISGSTKFQIVKRSVTCVLATMSASGVPTIANYIIPHESPEKAQEFVNQIRACVPAA